MKSATVYAFMFLALFIGFLFAISGHLPAEPPPAKLYAEAEYHFYQPISLWKGDLRRVENGAPVLEGEPLALGSYYAELPVAIETDAPHQLHQYAMIHVLREPAEGSFVLAATRKTVRDPGNGAPRRRNSQPGADRNWVCQVSCDSDHIAVCEDGICGCFVYNTMPEDVREQRGLGNTEYSANGRNCGIPRN